MQLEILKQPSETIISVDEMKSHLRILHNDEDKYIEYTISAATSIIEKNTGKSILTKLYRYTVNPSIFISSFSKIWLPIAPLLTVKTIEKSVSLVEKEKITNFSIETENDDYYIKFRSSMYPVQINFYAGLSEDRASVPKDLKHAVLHVAKNIYEGDDEKILEIPYIKNILKGHKNLSII